MTVKPGVSAGESRLECCPTRQAFRTEAGRGLRRITVFGNIPETPCDWRVSWPGVRQRAATMMAAIRPEAEESAAGRAEGSTDDHTNTYSAALLPPLTTWACLIDLLSSCRPLRDNSIPPPS